MERRPREWWVINDRAGMAGVCLRLTWFDPKCYVSIATGQSCSLWMVENPWSNKVVCMVGMNKRGGGERRGGGAEWEFRRVQLHTTAKRTPCPTFAPWPGATGTSPTSLLPNKQTHRCQRGAPLICAPQNPSISKKLTIQIPNLAGLPMTESQGRALIDSSLAWRHDTTIICSA